MKSQLKKFAALFLSVCVALSIMTVASFAADSKTYDLATYSDNPNGGSAVVMTDGGGKDLDSDINVKLYTGSSSSGPGSFTSQLRVYQGAYAVITSAKDITSVKMNVGHKDGTIDVFTSTDGSNWTKVHDAVAYTSAYSDKTFDFATATKYIKIVPTKQLRIKTMTVDFVGGGTTPDPTPTPNPDPTPTPSDPAADSTLTIEQAIALGQSKAHSTYTDGKYYVEGKITEFNNGGDANSFKYGNFYIADEAGKSILVYGLYSADGTTRYDAMTVKPVVGDTVKVYGVVGQYSGKAQLKNTWLIVHTPATTPNPDPTPTPNPDPTPTPNPDPTPSEPADGTTLTIPEAVALAKDKAKNEYTTNKFKVTGKVVAIASEQYGNLYIADEAGNELYIYGVKGKDGSYFDKLDPKVEVGDTVTLYGSIGKYNDVQMKNAVLENLVKGQGSVEDTDPKADSVLTVKEAIELGLSKRHDTYTAGKYYVTGTITEIYNEQYGNMKITDKDGNILNLYGTYAEDGTSYADMAVKPAVGDEITIYGIIGQYDGTAQIKNGSFKAAPTEDEENKENNKDEDNKDEGNKEEGEKEEGKVESPETGDTSTIAFAIAMMLLAGAAFVASKKRV